ncbi:MAG TPA: hypothetical protein VFE33_22255 [Thermoanaerobaculia bacterium]|nr:hypothetical protein [Thermoanaerobaculia bacterium]
MRTLAKILLPLCLLLTFVTAATAQPTTHFPNATAQGTPDGVPPSGETVCNGLVGAAHGLCTAYCEAMDCDSGSPQASTKACAKVADNFLRITGQGLPCDCPCVAQVPDFIQALNGQFGLVACIDQSAPGFEDFVVLVTGDNRFPGADSGVLENACGFAFTGPAIEITPQQAVACVNLTRQKAAAAGLTCGAP